MCIDAIQFSHPDADAQVSNCAAHAIFALRKQSGQPESQVLRGSHSSGGHSSSSSSSGVSGGDDTKGGSEEKPVVIPVDPKPVVVVSDSCATTNKPGVVASNAFDFQVAVGALPNPTNNVENSISALEVDFMLTNIEASSTMIPEGATVWMYASF